MGIILYLLLIVFVFVVLGVLLPGRLTWSASA